MGARVVPLRGVWVSLLRFISVGMGNFQPKGLARIRKNPKRPKVTPKTTKIIGEILPEFIDYYYSN